MMKSPYFADIADGGHNLTMNEHDKQAQDNQKPLDTSVDYSIDSVLKIGGAYLTTSWFLLREALIQHDPRPVYSFAIFGVVVQIAFAFVIHAQRDARCKAIGVAAKGFVREDQGDVVIIILNCLAMVLAVSFFLFLLLVVISQLPGITVHPLTL